MSRCRILRRNASALKFTLVDPSTIPKTEDSFRKLQMTACRPPTLRRGNLFYDHRGSGHKCISGQIDCPAACIHDDNRFAILLLYLMRCALCKSLRK